MRFDTEHKAKTRERILKEAAAAIRVEGPERIGVAAIMSRAGLTHGGFYAHFKSKDELVAQAIGYMFEDRYAAFFARLDAPDPRTALKLFINSYLSIRHRDAIDRGCPLPVLSGDIPRLSVAARETFVAAVDRLTEVVTRLLEELGIADAPIRVSSILSEMVGAIALARVQPNAAKAEALLAHSRQSILQAIDLG